MITDKQFAEAVVLELEKARSKFPDRDALNCALVEEVGEVSTALMYESWDDVVKEAVQVAAMAQRLAVEGDITLEPWRESLHLGNAKD